MTRHLKLATIVILIAVALALGGFVWWQLPGAGTTAIKLTGAPGDSFTGFYVQHGKRIDVNDVLPWKFAASGISKAEFRKTKADEGLTLEAHYSEPHGMNAVVNGSVKPEFVGIRFYVHRNGIAMEPVK